MEVISTSLIRCDYSYYSARAIKISPGGICIHWSIFCNTLRPVLAVNTRKGTLDISSFGCNTGSNALNLPDGFQSGLREDERPWVHLIETVIPAQSEIFFQDFTTIKFESPLITMITVPKIFIACVRPGFFFLDKRHANIKSCFGDGPITGFWGSPASGAIISIGVSTVSKLVIHTRVRVANRKKISNPILPQS
jgi:hypothetical protein